jgi:hypothetical protein
MWDSKGYHGVHTHMIGTEGNGCTTMVCVINRKAACRRERERLPTATGGGVLAAATGSHVTSAGAGLRILRWHGSNSLLWWLKFLAVRKAGVSERVVKYWEAETRENDELDNYLRGLQASLDFLAETALFIIRETTELKSKIGRPTIIGLDVRRRIMWIYKRHIIFEKMAEFSRRRQSLIHM